MDATHDDLPFDLPAPRALADTLMGRPLDGSRQDPRADAIGLHAWRITFRDPATGAETTVTCPLPSGPPWPGGPT